MFSYFTGKPKNKNHREYSPLTIQIEREKSSEEETLYNLSSELKVAQKQINILLEQKKILEGKLLEKEKENLSLFEKLSTLNTTCAEEKETFLKQQKTYLEEEQNLLQKIAELQAAVSAKETECQLLLAKIPPLEAVVHEKAVLEEESRLQQEQNQTLLKRISEMEVIKRELEYKLNQEKIEHNKTRALYEEEKSCRFEEEMTTGFGEVDDAPSSTLKVHSLFSPKNKTPGDEQIMPFAGFYHGLIW